MKRVFCVMSGLLLAASAAAAQGPGGGASVGIATGLQRQYAALKTNLTQSAEKMSEADYNFKPNEMYGIGTVYLRLKGLVPPSTENQGRGRGGDGRGRGQQ